MQVRNRAVLLPSRLHNFTGPIFVAEFYIPGPDSRTLIVGKTGTGKTYTAVWHLSTRDYMSRPWVIFDYKGDPLLGSIDAEELDILDNPPDEPGIYIVRPFPDDDDNLVNDFLKRIWVKGNTGIYIDEGYMVPSRSGPFKAILTQGRSKQIPVIVLSQRPVWLTRFAISEADYYQVFWLNDRRDRQVLESFLPELDDGRDVNTRLEQYHSWFYDVSRDNIMELGPVRSIDKIVEKINSNLETLRAMRNEGVRKRPRVL